MGFMITKITNRSWELRINGMLCGIAVIDPGVVNNWIIPGGDKMSDNHRKDIIASFVDAWKSAERVKNHFIW